MTRLLTLCLLFCAGLAWAHSGVDNVFVKQRMDLMENIKRDTATLGDMAKGTRPFDAATAKAAKAALIDHAERIPARFRQPETDPMSEARPEIWTDWAGYEKATATMLRAAQKLNTGSLDGLRRTLPDLGRSCTACHEGYRIKK